MQCVSAASNGFLVRWSRYRISGAVKPILSATTFQSSPPVKEAFFLRVYQVSVIRPFGMFENTRKTFINHEQGREKLNPNILDSSASVVRTPTRCASLSTDVALRTLWPTQLKTALKRSIAKQRHKHRTKREKDKRTHFILMYHLQPYAVKGINLFRPKF